MQTASGYNSYSNSVRYSSGASTAPKMEYEVSSRKKRHKGLKLMKNNSFGTGDRRRFMTKALIMAAIILVICIGFTAYGSSMNYHINEKNSEINKLENEIENLNLKVTANSSPETIEEKAINDLGMVYPSASEYVYVNSGSAGVYTADAK